jgi:RimK family alpha-L-glutamate ligase
MKIGVLADPGSWHFKDLLRAAGERHDVLSVSFVDLLTSLGEGETEFLSGSVDLQTLDRLVIRTMPRGSLQQIIFRMNLLGRLAHKGVSIVNPPRTIEIAVDKYLSLCMLAEAEIAVPPTRVAESLPAAMKSFEVLGGDVVYKPIFGSMGTGVTRLSDAEQARQFFDSQINDGQVIYLQKFIDHGDWDIRILIVGDRTFAIKRQRDGHWLTNIAQGAIGAPHEATDQEIAVARTSAEVTGCELAGVDLFYDRNSGRPMVCDVNAAPGWKATANVLQEDIAQAVIDAVVGYGRRSDGAR